MKTIKYILLIAIAGLLTSIIGPQQAELSISIKTSDNYYNNIYQYLRHQGQTKDNFEGSEHNQLLRDYIKWGQRLAPSGSISKANQAINAYNCAYQYTPSSYNPNWTCIGPTGKPKGPSYTGNGQMHRITFDPSYNEVDNFTIYAVSNFGGVWRSTTPNIKWHNLNTDKYLPFTTVSDIAVHSKNSNILLISTGDGDYGRIYDKSYSEINGVKIGPTQTSGIYRSTDAGDSWHRINGPGNSLCNTFSAGGNTRRILINPIYPDHAYVATTKGIYRSTNITDEPEKIEWELVLSHPNDTEFRGLAIKPDGRGKTIYASGKDIYRSQDGGTSWTSMSTQQNGPDLGLDSYNMPRGIKDIRINITTSIADPERLYAHIYGFDHDMSCVDCKAACRSVKNCQWSCQSIKSWNWVFIFQNNRWHKVLEKNNCSPIGAGQRRWIGIAASPVNPNYLFIGTTNVYGSSIKTTWEELLTGKSIKDVSGYNSKGVHADIHDIKFAPFIHKDSVHPILLAATHGGISLNTMEHLTKDYKKFNTPRKFQLAEKSAFKKSWQRVDKGLSVATIYDMDQSYFYPDQIVAALQDNGVVIHDNQQLTDSSQWKNVLGGDGYASMFDPHSNSAWINNGKIYRFDYKTRKKVKETTFMPIDPIDKFITQTRRYVSRPHPQTGKMYTAFGELYERKMNYPAKDQPKEDVWKLRSDIGKGIGMGWQRNITDFKISENNPNYIYVVSAGVESRPPDDFYTKSRIFRSTTGGCDGIEDFDDTTSDPTCFHQISTDEIPTVLTGLKSLPMMKSVAIHPSNPNKIWVAFSGYDPNIKVLMWEYNPTTNQGTWTNADPYNTLNNLPINFIIHQKGTEDRLYIGTDAGVWIKDEGNDKWTTYGDFPNVRVTDLKANYCSQQLVVSTWGRSAWIGDLLPMTTDYHNPVNILPGNVVFWTKDRVLENNLRIKTGATLHIQNATIMLPQHGKIIVEPGAKIILSNAKLKNNCTKSWLGIEVLTDPKDVLPDGRIINNDSEVIL